jgi:hypothetical protein
MSSSHLVLSGVSRDGITEADYTKTQENNACWLSTTARSCPGSTMTSEIVAGLYTFFFGFVWVGVGVVIRGRGDLPSFFSCRHQLLLPTPI